MKTLHIAPGDSAGGSLIRAIRDAGLDDEVLRFRDDLSCGPIDSDEASARAAWWSQFYDMPEVAAHLDEFWKRVAATVDRLVVWFGRHSASEHAFFLAWADRLGDRAYEYIDVTGLRFPRRDGSGMGEPVQSVGIMNPDMLRSVLGTERALTPKRRMEAIRAWRRLKAENAPFRIVTAEGLASAPVDCYDRLILERATSGWRRVARIIGDVMGHNYEPYIQVGDVMLHNRVVALVCEGKLLADGDPWDLSCPLRLPEMDSSV
jgi:Protein of unknown function/Domain of unknown function (DUF1835)